MSLNANYYDRLGDEHLFGKQVATNKYALAGGLDWSTTEKMMVPKPKGDVPSSARYLYFIGLLHGFFLFLLVIAQIVIAVLVFVFIGDVSEATKKGFERVFHNRENLIYSELECCGKHSFLDHGVNLPQSCCSSSGVAPICVPFQSGCLSRIAGILDSAGNIVVCVSLGFAAIELVCVISACCLVNAIRNKQRRSGYYTKI